jgi:GSCFA family
MNFHLEFSPKSFEQKIFHQDKLLLVGSCFTEQIGNKFLHHKFNVLQNTNGILFNPISIAQSLTSYIENNIYTETDLFYENECWHSWQHHSRFSHPDKTHCLKTINQSQQTATDFLKTADWIFITLGSAFVYQLLNGTVVANCHKVQAEKFAKKLLSVQEVLAALDNVIHRIFMQNKNAKIIFTISPVRHLREGFVENNRSKAVLIQAVHQLINKFNNLFYFPAYELVIDDLRDYRFFAEDMVHPNYAATNYVWQKFVTHCVDEQTIELMKVINEINAAINHKPFNPTSEAHQKFKATNVEKIKLLQKKYSYLNFAEEEKYFSN